MQLLPKTGKTVAKLSHESFWEGLGFTGSEKLTAGIHSHSSPRDRFCGIYGAAEQAAEKV
jgi:hypothetical protein